MPKKRETKADAHQIAKQHIRLLFVIAGDDESEVVHHIKRCCSIHNITSDEHIKLDEHET